MKVWGLTGGIGSGKSTVSGMFAARGLRTINADAAYHELLKPQKGMASALAQQVIAAFPEESLLRNDGSIDRNKLGSRVFRDSVARQKLESITHPAVAEAVAGLLQQLRDQGVAHALYDVPLLFERGLEDAFNGVLVVWVPRHVQQRRVAQRDGMGTDEVERRIRAQLPLDDKKDKARWVIDNSGPLRNTEAQVDTIWEQMKADGA